MNRYRDVFREAFSELLSSKLSLFFMTFGLVVGIAAMTAIFFIGRGTQRAIVEVLESLNFGSNSLLVLAGGGKFFGPATTRRDTFKMEDVEALKRLDFVVEISPVQIGILDVSRGPNYVRTRVLGVFPVYSRIDNWRTETGRFITERDLRAKTKVCVLGAETKKKLFGSENPLGKRIEINGVKFVVVGVLERKGVVGRYRLDERVLVPFTTAKDRIFNRDWIDAAKIEMVKGIDVKKAKAVIAGILRKRHHLLPNEENDFRIITPDQIVFFLTRASRTLTALLLVVSMITVLVSGVIVMNIMFSVVEERRKIIALRRALGAKKSDILIHYLIFSQIVAVIGVVIGFGLGSLINLFISRLSPVKGCFVPWFFVVCLAFSSLTCFIFSLAPARKAADLMPAELLR